MGGEINALAFSRKCFVFPHETLHSRSKLEFLNPKICKRMLKH